MCREHASGAKPCAHPDPRDAHQRDHERSADVHVHAHPDETRLERVDERAPATVRNAVEMRAEFKGSV